MIQTFSAAASVSDFVQKVTESLSGRELGKIVTLNTAPSEVSIIFSKLGKSEVVYNLTSSDNGFKCEFKSEKIALTHRPLRNDIESKLARVLEENGASVVFK